MVYINKDTFEIYENLIGYENELDNYFECDEFIAYTIMLLNIKGYKTNYCCAGHIYPERQRYKGNEVLVYFNTYISFEDVYNFESIPDGFYLSRDKKSLHADFEDVNFSEDRKEQILEALENLYLWASLLLPIKNRGDE